ncbi:MAG TPA: hypothetical protein PLB62_13940 [Candidatus Sumerlaeota bacterium]|nr:hypothetical protein [Candidatus Sumerlaeota bacterium]
MKITDLILSAQRYFKENIPVMLLIKSIGREGKTAAGEFGEFTVANEAVVLKEYFLSSVNAAQERSAVFSPRARQARTTV